MRRGVGMLVPAVADEAEASTPPVSSEGCTEGVPDGKITRAQKPASAVMSPPTFCIGNGHVCPSNSNNPSANEGIYITGAVYVYPHGIRCPGIVPYSSEIQPVSSSREEHIKQKYEHKRYINKGVVIKKNRPYDRYIREYRQGDFVKPLNGKANIRPPQEGTGPCPEHC